MNKLSFLSSTKRRLTAWILLLVTALQIFSPTVAYSLTSGPSQPEFTNFQPAGTTEMVDLFSGDFSYNIPLFELPGPNGGYPFSLSYQSGITMDQDASWVGLGWSLNPGAINRQVRGLPDDFSGDKIMTQMSINPTVTVGVGVGPAAEVLGAANDVGIGGLSLLYNNYKGLGYSLDASLGYAKSVGLPITAKVGARLSLNSLDGPNLTPSFSLGSKIGSIGLSAGINAISGLSQVGLHGSTPMLSRIGIGIYSSTLSVASPGYMPQVPTPMRNFSVSATFNSGGAGLGIFGKGYIKGFYSEQKLKWQDREVESPGYGYLYYDNGTGHPEALLDFNREKDGMVSKETPNLGIPSLTYDVYSVTGQGIGAMYRPIRNDIGIVHDPESISESSGTSIGVDGAPALSHVGLNLMVNYSKSVSGEWKEKNLMASQTGFQSAVANDAFEPWNFKVHGELTGERRSILNVVGGIDAVRVAIDGGNKPNATTTLEKRGWSNALPAKDDLDRGRKQRNDIVQTLTNDQVLAKNSAIEALPFFTNKYYNNGSVVSALSEPTVQFVRTGYKPHHIAGFTALNSVGLRYNYTIPVYNQVQEEYQFSTNKSPTGSVVAIEAGENGNPKFKYDATEQFFKKTSVPGYAYSYLLTSIVGPDYVDLSGDGVSKDDLGYWVKFSYEKATSDGPYKWREPFVDAHYSEGWLTDSKDNKGSFTYGEKDVWYLVKAESKSHVAVFDLEDRTYDGMGAADRLQLGATRTGKKLKQLKSISLFSRMDLEARGASAAPLKKVNFGYMTSAAAQCQNVPNGGGGKLTLEKVWFTYGLSQRAANQLSPYVFKYGTATLPTGPNYQVGANDRWGVYKPCKDGDCLNNVHFPYSEQYPEGGHGLDEFAASWSLREIQTPAGSTILVDYESDDYAYVQHKQAMQMTQLVPPTDPVVGVDRFSTSDSQLKIRFKLHQPIAATTELVGNPQRRKEILQSYLDIQRKQLFFKILVNLKETSDPKFEYVTGYADIDFQQPMDLEKVGGSANYEYGSFYITKEGYTHTGVSNDVHPFAMRAWQHLRTNQPNLIREKSTGQNVTETRSLNVVRNLFTELLDTQLWNDLKLIFGGYYSYCDNHNWGREIKVAESWIRLNSVDKTKYGGGLRVSQITIKDNWDDDGIYGQVFDYTLEEPGSSNPISSGVASYEPIIGGEENSLRYAKKYTESVALQSDNNLFFELPVNESYYPGPQVGYRKVTVTSLASAALSGKTIKHDDLPGNRKVFPSGASISWGTTGKTVHEFYTAKDFPVVSDETEKRDVSFTPPTIPIPFLGYISLARLTSTQGYSVRTNDMHGKPKQVSTYRQSPSGGFESDPISYVKYNYISQPKYYEGESVFMLSAAFEESIDGALVPSNSPTATYTMGQENEFFLDMRQHEDTAYEGGANLNLDVIQIPILAFIPIPTSWPSIGKSSSQLRTAVANKIVFTPGILQSVEAYDGGAISRTENLKWDKLTGAVVLSSVKNNFDNPVYSYNIPAYTQYKGLGGAYQNLGLSLNCRVLKSGSNYFVVSNIDASLLYPGDEIVLSSESATARVIYMGNRGGFKRISPVDNASASVLNLGGQFKGYVFRSGYRNQLSAAAGSITGLSDPTVPSTQVQYHKTVTSPSNP